jgi:NADPH:quinone reductase-like Zn-dependent oxidoreductase
MLAWVCRDYGGPGVVALAHRPVPTPGPHQLLVQVETTTVESGDARIRSRQIPRGFGLVFRLILGWRRPRQGVLGSVVVGTVVAVGPGVRRWAPGDRIVATTGMAGGAHAQFTLLSDKRAIVHCPPALTPVQAAAVVFGGLAAQFFLDRAEVQPGEQVLVIGATGSVGGALVQLAKARGAVVTALCSAANLPRARALGAAHALDYRAHPPSSLHPLGFDVVADSCAASSFGACLPLLRLGGRYLNIAGDLPSMLVRPRQGRRSISGTAAESTQDLQRVLDLAAQGVLVPMIDSVWSFTEPAAAHARAGSGHKSGCVVVQVAKAGPDPNPLPAQPQTLAGRTPRWAPAHAPTPH